MTLSRRTLLALAAASALTLLPSCNRDSGKIKIAVVTNNPEDFWTICEKGAQDAANKHGVDLIFRRPERAEAGVQLNILNELVAKGAKGIAVSVIDPENQTPDLKRIAKETNLITMDNDAKDSDRLTYIGTDNYEAGKAVGRLIKEVKPNGGTVAVFVGQITPINARLRVQGVFDELAGQKDAKGPTLGKYTLYRNEAITDNGQRATCLDNAKDALAQLAGKENLCMVGLWAYNAPAILEAVKSKNLAGKVKIVSFDEDAATLSAIEAGEIYATVVQDPYNFGYKSVEVLAEAAKSGDKASLSKEPVRNIMYRVVAKESSKDPVTGADRLAVGPFRTELNRLMGR
jgi:ribose transport system substrate-binding protein